jgi:hypothetical protein
MPRCHISGSYSSFISSFLRDLHTAYHSGYTNLHSHQQHIMVPFFATFLSAFVVVTTLDSGHSNWGEMKSQCCLDNCSVLLTSDKYIKMCYLAFYFIPSLFFHCVSHIVLMPWITEMKCSFLD